MQSGRTLALVGGDVNLKGAILTAEGGIIDLGGVGSGQVLLTPINSGWTLGYEKVLSFKNIQLSQQALINTSGERGGDIQLSGREITFSAGSLALIQDQGSQPAGILRVNATNFLKLSGTSPDGHIGSGLRTEALGVRDTGEDIEILTKNLLIEGGGAITTKTLSSATGGNITVEANNAVQLNGASPIDISSVSSILALSTNSGKAGNIAVTTGGLTAVDGGTVSSSSLGTGAGGNVTVNSHFVKVLGSTNNGVSSVLGGYSFQCWKGWRCYS